MIGEKDAIATIAVKDIEVARKFYTDILGLKPVPVPEPVPVPVPDTSA